MIEQAQLVENDNSDKIEYSDLHYNLIKQYFSKIQSKASELDQLHLLTDQNKILKNIQEELAKKKKTVIDVDPDVSVNLSTTSLAFRPVLTMPIKRTSDYNVFWEYKSSKQSANTTLQDDIRMKRGSTTRIISQGQIQKALNEIQEKCELSTTQIIKHLINRSADISKKLRQNQQMLDSLEKAKKQCQQLKLIQAELQKKVIDNQSKIKNLEQENISLKQTNPNKRYTSGVNNDREKQLQKLEVALVLKEKLVNEDIKKLNSKITLTKKHEEFIIQQRKMAQQIWQKIISHLESPGDEFKTNIYNKCKESLMTMRKHLQQQINQLDSRHQYIQKIISQIQNVF